MTIQQSMAAVLQRELQAFERELDLFPDDRSVWQTVPGVPNSAGNLALHVAGNLQFFVGRVLGGTSYVRDRDREFSTRSGSRADIVHELHNAAAAVRAVLPSLTSDELDGPFPEPVVAGRGIQTLTFLMHLCVHASFHLGQAGYVRRAVTGRTESAGPVPLTILTHEL